MTDPIEQEFPDSGSHHDQVGEAEAEAGGRDSRVTDESKDREDRARRFVWEDGDLEFLGNDPNNLPEDDDEEEEEDLTERILGVAADHLEKDGWVVYEDFIAFKPVDQTGNQYLFGVKLCLLEHGWHVHERRHRTEWNCDHSGTSTHFHAD